MSWLLRAVLLIAVVFTTIGLIETGFILYDLRTRAFSIARAPDLGFGIRSWTVHRTPENRWTLRAEIVRADPFKLRQKDLLFRAERKGGYFVWPVIGAALTPTRQLVATLGPPIA